MSCPAVHRVVISHWQEWLHAGVSYAEALLHKNRSGHQGPSSPEPTPIFCNCSWQLHPFLLPHLDLSKRKSESSVQEWSRDTQCVATICLLAWLCHCVFSDARKLFCTLLVSPAALPRHCLTHQRQRQESNTQVSCLACAAWQVLHSLVTRARAGSKPAAVQLSEQTRLGLFRKQCTLTPEGRVALPTPWLWQAPPPAASIPGLMPCLNLEDHSRSVALTALHTWQEMC